MTDDIKNLIERLDWSKFEGELKPKMLDIVEQLRRFTFALKLTGKVSRAAEFAKIGEPDFFMKYWFGPESYDKLKEYIESLGDCYLEMLEEFYNIGIKEEKEEEERERLIHESEPNDIDFGKIELYNRDLITGDTSLSYERVINDYEVHRVLLMIYDNPNFASGVFWLVSYTLERVKGKMRPFVIMARVNENDELCYMQGGWPHKHFDKMLERLVPIGYICDLKDKIYIELKVDIVEWEHGKQVINYESIRKVEGP